MNTNTGFLIFLTLLCPLSLFLWGGCSSKTEKKIERIDPVLLTAHPGWKAGRITINNQAPCEMPGASIAEKEACRQGYLRNRIEFHLHPASTDSLNYRQLDMGQGFAGVAALQKDSLILFPKTLFKRPVKLPPARLKVIHLSKDSLTLEYTLKTDTIRTSYSPESLPQKSQKPI